MNEPLTVPAWVDRDLYPFTPRTFATPEGRVAYLDEGSGPPVLLVHGTPSWSFEWREVVRALARDHRVIAPDHLGFGLSDKPSAPDAALAPGDHARRLLALVDHLDLRDLTLVVHDFGGPIGLPVALERRARVRRVVVLNSWMWPNAGDAEVARIDRLVRGPLGRFLYLTLNASPRWLLPSALGKRTSLTRSAHAHYLAPFPDRGSRASLYAMALALGGGDAWYEPLWRRRSELRGLPLSIVWGEKDPAFQARHLARWVEAFPEATVTRLPEVGHFPAEEAPAEVARAIA
jgi:haloalkane dehalogenase